MSHRNTWMQRNAQPVRTRLRDVLLLSESSIAELYHYIVRYLLQIRGRCAADPPAFRRRSAPVPHPLRTRSAPVPHRFRTGAAPVPPPFRSGSARVTANSPEGEKNGYFFVFWGVFVLLGVFLCFGGCVCQRTPRRTSAGVPHAIRTVLRTCSALAPHLLRTCSALVPHLLRQCKGIPAVSLLVTNQD